MGWTTLARSSLLWIGARNLSRSEQRGSRLGADGISFQEPLTHGLQDDKRKNRGQNVETADDGKDQSPGMALFEQKCRERSAKD